MKSFRLRRPTGLGRRDPGAEHILGVVHQGFPLNP
jgi:hypothetical protein